MKDGTIRVGAQTLRVLVAKHPWQKMRGMMLREWDGSFEGMVFPFSYSRRWGVEMPFCPPMDVVFVDGEKRVLEVQSAKPLTRKHETWKIYRPREKCRYVIELPPGKGKSFANGSQIVLNL